MTAPDQSPDHGSPDPAGWLPELGAWDETLLDEGEEHPADRALPDDAALRRLVLEQRLIHGLLAQRFDTAAARDARVRGILAALPASPTVGAPVIPFWRRAGPALAAAAVLLVTAAALMWSRSDAELIEDLWAQARQHLDDEIDREFTLDVERVLESGEVEPTGHHVFTLRPGGKFRIELQGEKVGDKTIGCDGVEVWMLDRSGGDGSERKAHDVRDRVGAFFRKELASEGFFHDGYLSLDSILDEVHDSVLLFEHDIEPMVQGGPSYAHIWGEGNFELGPTAVERIEIWFDRDSGMVRLVLLDLHDGPSDQAFHFRFEHVRDLRLDASFYARPWN